MRILNRRIQLFEQFIKNPKDLNQEINTLK